MILTKQEAKARVNIARALLGIRYSDLSQDSLSNFYESPRKYGDYMTINLKRAATRAW